MPFPCPGCLTAIDQDPERWLLRCPTCGARLRSRAVEAGGRVRLYDVEVAGRPETRRRVESPWSPHEQRRLSSWLLWSSVVMLGLVVVLYLLARWGV